MDFTAVARSAFSCREFTDEPVDDATVHRILDTARFAPNGGNRQGQRVIVVRDPGVRQRIVELCAPEVAMYRAQLAAGENPGNTVDPTTVDPASVELDLDDAMLLPYVAAPVLLVVGLDLRVVASTDRHLDRVGVISGASVYPFVWNLLLAARNEGLGGVLTTFLASAEPEAQQLLGLPHHVAVAAVVPIGYPAQRLTKLSRRPVEAFTTLDRYDGEPFVA